ncbi:MULTISPECIES: zinc-dependent alcohol dehydrogenase family protein [unclassified Pseudomonas]|uniref:zinc-dependent alcohol dehydrogenase family protein n=1 Tax=unclassified Pseudomonas TaxID=196821 RepID=UPI0021CA5C76|nr:MULTISPECIES: NAD(P)-dependent alcohol dehydrogenase [unclassified Pseudomonas]MCU1720735.1 NAD(P)-dependent alcohol dehydrogenase [Pseudomonas sp. 5P_5.1_Bac1]MCU1731494.1 NAD(P)-dependent alcohol dehydrogenase [Pseudomonas sp. 20P_3.2_Bac4]MCU1746587.1 NAD(P)-dependent alcohol dehydrogenase [Pseudomonas sp. 20P_3.2_Bac5]
MSKAIYVQPGGGYDKVGVGNSDAAAPAAGEITVRLHANSLNYHDFAVVSGVWGPTAPRIPMADGAGEVIAVGAGVSEFAVGDSVVSTFFPDWLDGEPLVEGFATVPGDGIDGYAREVVTARATSFTRAPKGFSHAEASTLTTAGLTAWRALMADDSLKPGDTVLVQGTGGVSIFALQFAKLAGATVIATSSSDEKLERLKALGADEVINYRSTPNWGEKVRALTDNRGVDHVIEVGGPATLEQSMTAVRIGGHISLIGILTGVAGQLPLVQALVRQIRLQGVLVGSRAQQQAMIRAIDANGLRPVIDKAFELEQIVEAFRYQESNQHFGKICLNF